MNERSSRFVQPFDAAEERGHMTSARSRIFDTDIEAATRNYLRGSEFNPLLIHGDALSALRKMPEACIDCVMTSPPYWSKREYQDGGIGLEADYEHFIDALVSICDEIQRVLKPEGSFWLNLGDSYKNKGLVGIPWRVALTLTDDHGWILRNSVIWNKVKSGMDNSKDRLGNVHENIFHFVKQSHYYYDADAIRTKPREARVVNGAVVSATGVTGVRYKRQIELSTELSEDERAAAYAALDKKLLEISQGRLSDFRMIIRGQQRTTHSDKENVSGRAKELKEKGFYFLKYHPNGSKPADVWDILPEDTQNRNDHFAPYPIDLCRIPILATCPENGLVLDPFCGTGTTLMAAQNLNRRSIGIDISRNYLVNAAKRCERLI